MVSALSLACSSSPYQSPSLSTASLRSTRIVSGGTRSSSSSSTSSSSSPLSTSSSSSSSSCDPHCSLHSTRMGCGGTRSQLWNCQLQKRQMLWSSGGAEEERAHQEDGCGQKDGPEVFPHPGQTSFLWIYLFLLLSKFLVFPHPGSSSLLLILRFSLCFRQWWHQQQQQLVLLQSKTDHQSRSIPIASGMNLLFANQYSLWVECSIYLPEQMATATSRDGNV